MESVDEITDASATKEVKGISAINSEAVHRICSGQVVLSLAIAVKELVENAIDAGATCIEIRLKEYGSETIEVIDNGSGVEECNFSALTLKHYTSKLKEFSDLESVSTLGFRGEALSSLCALSNLSILTRHNTVDYATRIEYDKNGVIKSKTPCPRPVGTTVVLSNLFTTLPVRHIEFMKNLKREFTKMCNLLYAYCIIAEGVRIICTNQTKKGARTTIVATQGSKDVKDNIIRIFGTKQLETLIEIKFHEPDQRILEDFSVKKSDEPLPFKFTGLVSNCTHGNGRSTNDRQFYFINSRPCEPTKIIKLVNEVYKLFNGNQYPFVYLNIITEQSQIDVNVTPDKRQIFMEKEKLLLATLKTSLLEMFKEFPSTLKLQNLNVSTQKSKTEESNVTGMLQQWTNDNDKSLNRGVKRGSSPTATPSGVMGYIYEKRLKIEELAKIELSDDSASEDEENKVKEIAKDSDNSASEDEENQVTVVEDSDKSSDSEPEFDSGKDTLDTRIKNVVQVTIFRQTSDTSSNDSVNVVDGCLKNELLGPNYENDVSYIIEIDSPDSTKPPSNNGVSTKSQYEDEQTDTSFVNGNADTQSESTEDTETNSESTATSSTSTNSYLQTIPVIEDIHTKNVEINVCEDDLKKLIARMHVSCKYLTKKETVVNFRSELTSKTAEEELQTQISKDMFDKMTILGQFNKGFIITQLKSDLFIIDQHATDEIYNFEMLQQTTVLQNQQLVNPKRLELTAANELLLMENIGIFKKNGFSFKVDENAESRNKVLLTAIPVSQNWEFGKEDIDELLFMLQEDGCLSNFRPSRVRAMFASRACRKSVMIGSALSHSDMRRLVDHMGQIEQPWNCPHGRPTMRHLINLDLIQSDVNQ